MTPAVAIPQTGIFRTKDHGYYLDGVGPLISVTTAIDMYDKSDALVPWASRETANAAINNIGTLNDHLATHNSPVPGCPPCLKSDKPFNRVIVARKWLAGRPGYVKDAAANLGTRVHTVAEALARGEHEALVQDPTLMPYAGQYLRFMEANDPEYLAVEYMGFNRTHGYGGTGDIICRPRRGEFDGAVVAIDIKTYTKPGPIQFYRGKPLYYPTTGMQLAACARFEVVGVSPYRDRYLGQADTLWAPNVVPNPFPAIDAYAVLLVGQEDYRLIPYSVTDETFEAFLHCLALKKWSKGEAQTIVAAA